MQRQCTLFTVGHSTHPLGLLVQLLARHDISAVADVRSVPYSRYCPQFNKSALAKSLKKHGISYVFLGRELGARADDSTCYVDGRVQYSRLARRPEFQQGIERLKKGSEKHRIALMCSEREPLDCHRTLLVARALDDEGLSVGHIHADGHLELHCDAMERLLEIVGLPHNDLFQSKEELLAEAFARQEKRVAYTNEQFAKQGPGDTP